MKVARRILAKSLSNAPMTRVVVVVVIECTDDKGSSSISSISSSSSTAATTADGGGYVGCSEGYGCVIEDDYHR